MKHPAEIELALYAGGELPFWRNWSLAVHVRKCESCRRNARLFAADRKQLLSLDENLPSEVKWDRLAQEMTGNIRVGLAAGECVTPIVQKHRRLHWRPALTVAAVASLVVGAWVLNMPPSETQALGRVARALWTGTSVRPVEAAGPIVESTASGLQVKENGSAMTLMNPGSQPVAVTVSMGGSVRARYVDADTAQVTITNVYLQ